jgi:alkylhydroperoxidase/carboxymuconolactone decarboxylase family protein YurZ
MSLLSNAFETFLSEAPEHAKAWHAAVSGLDAASALDKKTEELAYLAVLAALGRTTGVPFHTASARAHGASRQEVISAVLLGLPAAGSIVTQSLPIALATFDEAAGAVDTHAPVKAGGSR